MNLQEMIDSKTKLEAEMAKLKIALSQVEDRIDNHLQDMVRERLAIEEKDTGTVNFDCEGIQVKAIIEKKVKWDQKHLAETFAKIASSGDKPEQYIQIKFAVSETAYKSWPDQIKNVFLPARTVEVGRTKYIFGNGGNSNGA